jgi:tRNA nucleotidyltransferase/poly(A) polymerase
MELRLTPNQQKGVTLVQEISRNAGMNVYLTGGAVRDVISGFPIRDLDFTVQGNPLKLQKDFERAGAVIGGADDYFGTLYLTLPGGVRAEISSARLERHEKTGKPPVVSPATIIEDLRRRDFSVNAMALSLNPGSRGLLMDPFNGAADIEAKLVRVLHNYAFVEDPSRLIRASRFAARFHWPLEERTQARYDSAKENNYIEYVTDRAIGYEIEQLAYEDDPLNVVRIFEKEGWLKVLSPHWTVAKVDTNGLSQLMKTRQQMVDMGYAPAPAPAMLHFLTAKLNDKESSDIRKMIPRRDLAEAWRDLEDHAKELAKRLTGKEASTPSRTWRLLTSARPEMVLFLAVTARHQAVALKLKNFFTKWREVQQKIPLPEMTELLITPQLPEYPKIAEEVFLLLLDGKLRSRTERLNFLKPLAPPPPPPPPPPRRGRGAKGAPAAPVAPVATVAAKGGKKKGKGEVVVTAPAPLAVPAKAAASKAPAPPAKAVEASKAKKPAAAPLVPQKAAAKKPTLSPAKKSPPKAQVKPTKSAPPASRKKAKKH